MKMDRTIKLMLGIIILLLTVLVLRPVLSTSSRAWAQSASTVTNAVDQTSAAASGTSATNGDVNQTNVLGVRAVLASMIKIPSSDKVRNVMVVDSAHSFIVQYDSRFEVYWLDNVVERSDIKQYLQRVQQQQQKAKLAQ